LHTQLKKQGPTIQQDKKKRKRRQLTRKNYPLADGGNHVKRPNNTLLNHQEPSCFNNYLTNLRHTLKTGNKTGRHKHVGGGGQTAKSTELMQIQGKKKKEPKKKMANT